MTTIRTYLDYNASAPAHGAVRDAVARALCLGGNPSSVHGEGRAARAIVESARERVAELIGASGEDVIFTSGGTEANVLALHSALASGAVERLIVSAVEHASVIDAARNTGAPCAIVPVDADGVVDLAALEHMLEGSDAPALVCLMHANNETGVIQPVAEAASVAHRHGAQVHVDAIQTAGKLAIDMSDIGADTISLSSHKIGGPQGAGALVVRPGLPVSPLLSGGGQERGRRSGTENLPGIAGFSAAAEIVLSCFEDMSRVEELRDRLETEIRAATPDLSVLSADAPRLVNTSCLALPGARAETLVIALDLAGIAVSSGSACSSGKVGKSHVLAAMGVDDNLAEGAVRASLGWQTTSEDIDRFVAAWRSVTAKRRREREIAA